MKMAKGVIFYDVKSQEVEFLHGDALLTLYNVRPTKYLSLNNNKIK